jgi:hypothetical protein
MKRILVIAAGVVAGYLLLLVLVGLVLGGYVKKKVRARLAGSLEADVEIEDASVSLLRGKVTLRGIKIERHRGGTIVIEVDRVDAGIAPLGWAIVNSDPRRVAVRGVNMTLSGRGALALRERDAEPLRVREFLLEDVNIAVMPTTILPKLGRVEMRVARGRTGPVVLGSGVSWIFELRELDASAGLPGNVDVRVGYADEKLSLGGGFFGSRQVTVGFELPEPDPDAFEVEQLVQLAKKLARTVIKDMAKDWFDREVKDRVKDLID